MKFATILYADTADLRHPQEIVGRVVANLDFLAALIASENFSQYDFYFNSPFDSQIVKEQLESRLGHQLGRVNFLLLDELPRRWPQERYDVFHETSPLLHELAWCRTEYNVPSTILTGITHTLSDFRVLQQLPLLLMSPLNQQDVIFCTSQAAQQTMMQLFFQAAALYRRTQIALPAFAGQLRKLPLGVNWSAPINTDKAAARRKLGLPEDQTILLYFGRFSAMSKLDLAPLLECFAQVHQNLSAQKPPCLVLAGAVNAQWELQYVKELLSQNPAIADIWLLTNIEEPNKADLYLAADVFLSPSDNLQETFGLTVLEAMSAGLPVVATDWDGYRDLVVDKQTGYLIPTLWADCVDSAVSSLLGLRAPVYCSGLLGQTVAFDRSWLVQKLSDLSTQPALRAQLGEAGRQRAANFSWSRIAAEYVEQVRELIAQRNHQPINNTTPKNGRAASLSPAHLSLFQAFAHFASAHLRNDSMLIVTPAGQDVLDGKSQLDCKRLPVFMLHKYCGTMPLILKSSAQLSEVKRVVQLFAQSELKLTEEETTLLIMWLIKHGYLDVA